MKNIFSVSVAILLVLGLTSFEKKHVEVTENFAGEKWFYFIGDASDVNDRNDPNMYVLDGTGSSRTFCLTTTLAYRCEIKAQSTGSPARPLLNTIIEERTRSTPNP